MSNSILGSDNSPVTDKAISPAQSSRNSSFSQSPVDSYLLPLDINVDEFLTFKVAEPVDDEFGEKILNFLRFKNQVRFPVLRKADFESIHARRFEKPADEFDSQWNYEQFFLYMTYALCTLSFLGVSTRHTFKTPRKYDPFTYIHRAIIHARRCKNPDPLKQIQCLTMFTLFQIRHDIGWGLHWTMIDRAMTIAKRFNIHKQEQLENYSVYEQEERLRIFWSLYQVDRLLSFERGVPYIISEDEIDVPLYANVDETETDEEVILSARKQSEDEMFDPKFSSSMTISLHGIKLTILEAKIIDTIYCEDKSVEEKFIYVEYFLRKLDNWKASAPNWPGYTHVMAAIFHARAARLLLQPFLGFIEPTSPLFIRCMQQTGQIAQGCAEMLRLIKGFNLIQTSMLFVSSLTLIHGLWLASKSTLNLQFIIEDIRLCTCTLYALSERSSKFDHYRDTVEHLASATIRHIAENSSAKVPITRSFTSYLGPNDQLGAGKDKKDCKPSGNEIKQKAVVHPSFQDLAKHTLTKGTQFIKFRKLMDNEIEKAFMDQMVGRVKQRDKIWGVLPGSNICKIDEVESNYDVKTKKRKMDSINENEELASILDLPTSNKGEESTNSQSNSANIKQVFSPNYSSNTNGISSQASMSNLPTEQGIDDTNNSRPSSSLNDGFPSGRSSIDWWKNLENNVSSRGQTGSSWICTMGAHDEVSNWIYDLSNIAKKRLTNFCPNGAHLDASQSPQNGSSTNMMDSSFGADINMNCNGAVSVTDRDMNMPSSSSELNGLNPDLSNPQPKDIQMFDQNINSNFNSNLELTERSALDSVSYPESSSFAFSKPAVSTSSFKSVQETNFSGLRSMGTIAGSNNITQTTSSNVSSSSYSSRNESKRARSSTLLEPKKGFETSSINSANNTKPLNSFAGLGQTGSNNNTTAGFSFDTLGSLSSTKQGVPSRSSSGDISGIGTKVSSPPSSSALANEAYPNSLKLDPPGGLLPETTSFTNDTRTGNNVNNVNNSGVTNFGNTNLQQGSLASGQDADVNFLWSLDLNLLDFDDLVTWAL